MNTGRRYWQGLSWPEDEPLDQEAFARDLLDADVLHTRTGEPVEVPRRPGRHGGIWVWGDGQKERLFRGPPHCLVLLADRRGYLASD